jgi:4-amino-4-deoxy-L-arabinose transferase-like glycosyltransferase/membrane-associated phospholipid phosphatase
MQWLLDLDARLFRLIHTDLANSVLDQVMPLLSDNDYFIPAVAVAAFFLIYKGGWRGVVCVAMLALIVAIGDGQICRPLKLAIDRPRPFAVLEGVIPLVGKGMSASMPSSHAANWFAACMIFFIYYRRSLWITLPIACAVSYSRIYNGVHFPSDVLVGAVLGAGYAAAGVWGLDALWRWAGQKWFPLWWRRFPSLINPRLLPPPEDEEEQALPPPKGSKETPVARHVSLDDHWLILGYISIGIIFLVRLAYLASGTIQLSEDEAYQWVWSKHLALSYYSKPPMIAYTQFLGTSIWGDTEFGIRFFSPVIAAVLGLLVLRFFAREVNARAGFLLLLAVTATPLLAVGSVLMTVDPLSVLFWTLAMLTGWQAAKDAGTARDWMLTGLWMGMGFLSKYTALFQLLCWAVFFWLWPPSRKHLRRPGPYLALLVMALCTAPVIIWNAQHDWITVTHVSENAGAGKVWRFTLKYLGEFLGTEFGLLNPVFFVGAAWAAIAFWKSGRHNPKLVYFFCMGAPVFLVYLLQTFRSRVFQNWIAPSIVPLFCLMAIYWDTRWRLGAKQVKAWLATGLVLGFVIVVFMHDTRLIKKVTGNYLPIRQDPMRRVRQWDEVAAIVGNARKGLEAEGKPAFIIAGHYGIVSEITFYLPEAKAAVVENPLVYRLNSAIPRDQFFFWPGYTDRKGQSAVFVVELDLKKKAQPGSAPPELFRDFESVTPLGVYEVSYYGRVSRPIQLFACRNLK